MPGFAGPLAHDIGVEIRLVNCGAATADDGELTEWDADIQPADPLNFPDYPGKRKALLPRLL